MSKKVLPTTSPPIISYLHHAYPLSISFAHPSFIPWFYNNYVTLRCYKDILQYSNQDYFNFYNFNYYPCLDLEQISRDMLVDYFDQHIVDFLTRVIDRDYYALLYVDQYYLEGTRHYQTNHFTHDSFVYGYDNDTRELYLKGFLKNGSFTDYRVSYDDFTAANAHAKQYFSFQNYINLFKFDDGDYSLKIGHLRTQLSDYLQSRNPQDDTLQFINNGGRFHQPTNFGMATYDSLQEYFQLLRDRKLGNDIRPLQVMWEHKKIMYDRLGYLKENGYLQDDSLREQYEEVRQKTEMTRSLFLKFQRKQDMELLDTMSQFMIEVRQAEGEVLEKLWSALA